MKNNRQWITKKDRELWCLSAAKNLCKLLPMESLSETKQDDVFNAVIDAMIAAHVHGEVLSVVYDLHKDAEPATPREGQ